VSALAHPAASGDEPTWPEDAVEVGRVLGAWGVKGGIRVKPFSADPQALFSSRRWFIAAGVVSAARPAGARPMVVPRLLRITSAREHVDTVVATCQELSDRDMAQALSGARVFVSRSSFPTPDEDEFYWVDLIGTNVVNREGVDLGSVVGLIETGPHCVLRLSSVDAEGAERLIPFVASYIDKVDLQARRVTVDWAADF